MIEIKYVYRLKKMRVVERVIFFANLYKNYALTFKLQEAGIIKKNIYRVKQGD